ncbi:MAG: DedA family protein [Candidatus Dormibacteraeota bacterium]|nr:DedA family protein [Candidatus Dormibacteraeota bacterium]
MAGIQKFFLDLSNNLGSFAYLIVFLGVGIESLGVPVPGETALLVGVFLATQGRLSVAIVALVAWVGAVIGDNIGYAIGRRWGTRLVRVPAVGRFYSPARLERAEALFERRGWVAVFGGRFIALLRIFAGPLAGMHRMPWPEFVVANATGGALWVAVIVVVGVLIGNNLDRAISFVGRVGYIGLGAAIVLVLAYVGLRMWRRRRNG